MDQDHITDEQLDNLSDPSRLVGGNWELATALEWIGRLARACRDERLRARVAETGDGLSLLEVRNLAEDSSIDSWEPLMDAPGGHNAAFVYRGNALVQIAAGESHHREYSARWIDATSFQDKSASSFYVDLRYGGLTIDRSIFVSLDGDRCCVPQPATVAGDSGEMPGHCVPRSVVRYAALVDRLLHPKTSADLVEPYERDVLARSGLRRDTQ